MKSFPSVVVATLCGALVGPTWAGAQVTKADYERAQGLREQVQVLTKNVPEPATWMAKGHRFYYRKSEKGRFQFVVVDADTRQKQPAFDHDRLAAALTKGTGQIQTAARLPFTTFTFSADEKTIQFMTGPDERWQCTLADYVCRKSEPAPARPGEFAGMGGPRDPELARYQQPRPSPDGTLEAFVENFNLAVRSVGTKKKTVLSTDGSEGNAYDPASIVWSPDSKKIAAYRVRAGLPPRDPLHRVVAGGSGAAQAVVDAVRRSPATRWTSNSRSCSRWTRPRASRRQRPVPESL